MTDTFYRLVTRHSLDFLAIMMDTFCGDAHLSLEGDLRHFRFEQFQHLETEPNDVVARNTIWPVQQFVIIPLEAETIPIIKHHVLNIVGIRSRVLHILIEKHGQLVFVAYDQFHPETVGVIDSVDTTFLDMLVERHAIWSYQLPIKP